MISLLLFIAFVSYIFYEMYWKRRAYPPGPIPLPLAGNMISFGLSEPPGYEIFDRWRKEYGPIYTYWMGPFPLVVIADYSLIKSTIIKDGEKYADRFITDMTPLYRGGEYGVVESSGDNWREMRRFTLHTLRDFGMGKNLMEEKVMSEVRALLDRTSQKEVSPQWEIDIAVGSIINNVLFGYRFDEDKQSQFRELKELLGEHMKTVTTLSAGLAFTLPWTRSFPFVREAKDKIFYIRDRLFSFFRQQIDAKRQTIDYDSEENEDLVECFLKEQKKHENEPDNGFYSSKQLVNLLLDLWVAGMETTSNTLTWGIAYILNNKEVQKRIHSELDSVIKSDRLITLADKNHLPYLNATINEIQRMANLLPTNLFRKTTEEVQVMGYKIPKGTGICPQIATVLYDEKLFPSPLSFKPERFLNDDGSLKKVEELVPFSIGKRQCPGEGLARMELFLFLANIFQRFELSSTSLPSIKKSFGFTVQCSPYKCEFKERR
ncbi:unnamed protein product, partial [Mesorhabditis belari]|uniref:CYtochrome P450 family n=1 Tax=Mesorhabditis belari TaxID=2138241 RepID=A0AAF3EQ75_9BILA